MLQHETDVHGLSRGKATLRPAGADAHDALLDGLRRAVDWRDCLGLVAAYAFGSRCEGRARPGSDLDIGVVFNGPGAATPDGAQQLAKIETAVQRATSAPVDLVVLAEQPLAFQFGVVSRGTLLYERSCEERAKYEADLLSRYFDFLPTLRLFERYHMQGVRRRLAQL